MRPAGACFGGYACAKILTPEPVEAAQDAGSPRASSRRAGPRLCAEWPNLLSSRKARAAKGWGGTGQASDLAQHQSKRASGKSGRPFFISMRPGWPRECDSAPRLTGGGRDMVKPVRADKGRKETHDWN